MQACTQQTGGALLPFSAPAAIQFVVSDRAVSRNDYFTPPQIMILMTGGYILFIACESVVCYYIMKWNSLKQRRRVSRRRAYNTRYACVTAAGGC